MTSAMADYVERGLGALAINYPLVVVFLCVCMSFLYKTDSSSHDFLH